MSNHTNVMDTNRTREMIHQISVRLLSISIGVLLFSTTLASNATASSLNDKDFQIQAIALSNLGPGLVSVINSQTTFGLTLKHSLSLGTCLKIQMMV